MRTLAEALAEREFYARSTTAPAAPTAPSKREQKRSASARKLALLSSFTPPAPVGTGAILTKLTPSKA